MAAMMPSRSREARVTGGVLRTGASEEPWHFLNFFSEPQ
jgi:hypothetical protein